MGATEEEKCFAFIEYACSKRDASLLREGLKRLADAKLTVSNDTVIFRRIALLRNIIEVRNCSWNDPARVSSILSHFNHIVENAIEGENSPHLFEWQHIQRLILSKAVDAFLCERLHLGVEERLERHFPVPEDLTYETVKRRIEEVYEQANPLLDFDPSSEYLELLIRDREVFLSKLFSSASFPSSSFPPSSSSSSSLRTPPRSSSRPNSGPRSSTSPSRSPWASILQQQPSVLSLYAHLSASSFRAFKLELEEFYDRLEREMLPPVVPVPEEEEAVPMKGGGLDAYGKEEEEEEEEKEEKEEEKEEEDMEKFTEEPERERTQSVLAKKTKTKTKRSGGLTGPRPSAQTLSFDSDLDTPTRSPGQRPNKRQRREEEEEGEEVSDPEEEEAEGGFAFPLPSSSLTVEEELDRMKATQARKKKRQPRHRPRPSSSPPPSASSPSEDGKGAPRVRRRWDAREEDLFIAAVRRLGKKWALIKNTYGFGERTNVDLKDKWRNLERSGRVQLSD